MIQSGNWRGARDPTSPNSTGTGTEIFRIGVKLNFTLNLLLLFLILASNKIWQHIMVLAHNSAMRCGQFCSFLTVLWP